jgi:hypothetical protein
MVKHKLSGTGELDAIADSVEQLHPIFLFKLLYVLADGRLTDEQFVGSLSETQECSHTSENFQSCIYHCMFLCYFKNPRQYDAECSKSSAKIMQMSAMKTCFQIAECSKSSAKITKF